MAMKCCNKPINKQTYEARAKVLKAMAHPTRLIIIDELAREPRCVQELTAIAGCDQSTVSKHLSVLKEAGVVRGEKQGVQMSYSLRVPCILNFFGCVEAVLAETEREQRELADSLRGASR